MNENGAGARLCAACKKQSVAVTGDICGICRTKLELSEFDDGLEIRWRNVLAITLIMLSGAVLAMAILWALG